MEKITCGCGATVLDVNERDGQLSWRWLPNTVDACLVSYSRQLGPKQLVGEPPVHCPGKCGCKLSFTPDGTPVVGPSYDELEKVLAVMIVEAAIRDAKIDCDCSAQNIAGYVARYYTGLCQWEGIDIPDRISQPMMHEHFGGGGPDGARSFVRKRLADALPGAGNEGAGTEGGE